MNDWNKLLWLLFVVAINGIISLVIKQIENKKILIALGVIFLVILIVVSSCWVFFFIFGNRLALMYYCSQGFVNSLKRSLGLIEVSSENINFNIEVLILFNLSIICCSLLILLVIATKKETICFCD